MKYKTTILALIVAACSPQPDNNEALLVDNQAIPNEKEQPELAAAANGPFGYSMGQAVNSLGLEKMDKPGFYHTASPKKPHTDFESVVIEAYPSTGICSIRGVGKSIEGDGNGASVRAKVQELAEALATRYGSSHKVDQCGGGEIQCDPQFWMMTLDGGERYYGFEWTAQNQKMEEANIGRIDVAAKAADISTSYPVIEYTSSNKAECDKASRASSASSL